MVTYKNNNNKNNVEILKKVFYYCISFLILYPIPIYLLLYSMQDINQ